MAFANVDKQGGQTVEIAAEDFAQHPLFHLAHQSGVIRPGAGELGVKFGQRRFARRIDEKVV